MSLNGQMRTFWLWLLPVGGFIALTPGLFAQAPAAETVQQRISVPGLREATANLQPSSQNMGNIKQVEEYPEPEMFTFVTSQEFFYTDNVFYTHRNPLGSSGYAANYTAS